LDKELAEKLADRLNKMDPKSEVHQKMEDPTLPEESKL
jgi:hypothetical protein